MGRTRSWRRCVLAAAMSVVVVSCGGSSGQDSNPTRTDGASGLQGSAGDDLVVFGDPAIVDVATAVFAAHGAVDGFAVAVVALDRGYSMAQIIEQPTIDATGSIPGLAPAGPPLGSIEGSGIGPQGLRSTSTTEPPPRPRDRIAFLWDVTLGEVYADTTTKLENQAALAVNEFEDAVAEQIGEDWKQLTSAERSERISEEQDRAVAEEQARLKAEESAKQLEQEEQDLLTAIVFTYLSRGYSLEQTLEGLFFGDFIVGHVGQICVGLSEPPAGPPIEGLAINNCTVAFSDETDANALDDEDEVAPTSPQDAAPASDVPSADTLAESPDDAGDVADGSYSGALVLDSPLLIRLLDQAYEADATVVTNDVAVVVRDGQIVSFSATLESFLVPEVEEFCQSDYFYTFDGDGVSVVINGEITGRFNSDCSGVDVRAKPPIEAMMDLQSSSTGVQVVVFSDATSGRVVASLSAD